MALQFPTYNAQPADVIGAVRIGLQAQLARQQAEMEAIAAQRRLEQQRVEHERQHEMRQRQHELNTLKFEHEIEQDQPGGINHLKAMAMIGQYNAGAAENTAQAALYRARTQNPELFRAPQRPVQPRPLTAAQMKANDTAAALNQPLPYHDPMLQTAPEMNPVDSEAESLAGKADATAKATWLDAINNRTDPQAQGIHQEAMAFRGAAMNNAGMTTPDPANYDSDYSSTYAGGPDNALFPGQSLPMDAKSKAIRAELERKATGKPGKEQTPEDKHAKKLTALNRATQTLATAMVALELNASDPAAQKAARIAQQQYDETLKIYGVKAEDDAEEAPAAAAPPPAAPAAGSRPPSKLLQWGAK